MVGGRWLNVDMPRESVERMMGNVGDDAEDMWEEFVEKARKGREVVRDRGACQNVKQFRWVNRRGCESRWWG